MQFHRRNNNVHILAIIGMLALTLACGNAIPSGNRDVETADAVVDATQPSTESVPMDTSVPPEPTATNTLVVPPTDTPRPSPTPPEPTATNTPVLQLDKSRQDMAGCTGILTTVVDLNVREGPGHEYKAIALVPVGQILCVSGKSNDGTWWRVEYPLESGGKGWVYAPFTISENTDAVPVVAAP